MMARCDAPVGELAVTPEAAFEWASKARPGERFVYFTGSALSQSLPVVAAARKLEAAGEVLFLQERKAPGVRDYIMQKRRNVEPPVLSRAGIEERAPGTRVDDDLEDLMAVLRRLANLGLECPSNAKLAEMAGLKDAESARYRLGLLGTCGRVNVKTLVQGQRIVTIVASGRSTSAGGQG